MKKLLLATALLGLTAGFASADVVRLATEGAYPCLLYTSRCV